MAEKHKLHIVVGLIERDGHLIYNVAALLGPDGRLLGPTDCALERLQGKWRRHMVLKLPPTADVDFIRERLKEVVFPDIQIVVDVDPQSLI